ncbi:MAG: 4-(cytidine 5'-diphospho)-2-C-methyl-D-erythritol kinase [Chloroflexi bacterium]|jgi:4-diphosphocytidyl-2-C-methyl-D-erythritol kinase|nr:4-(cytidine 5'-diphospho)-2-C-methyl-D-erythritol kinase [Chloroflexota bacterium]MBT4072204.1 4-(cytidine 5'-diphospho)-2-C-methyl-D-erythritol kinase [Chloroflexota bacterium]MBT6680842.1 4-(cytidine 5'-diphospho)-2-C-methyl-D-erythritol kinase [Chloroflexota bacterium]
MSASSRIEIEAHAKVNLTLEILGKRDDGYHDIVSIMQTIDLHDTVSLSASDDITLICDDPGLDGENNLALVAARRLQKAVGVSAGAEIRLEKRIPVSAGLGGGSSDAATVLNGLNRLWDLKLPLPELEAIAAEVGSDVPYLLSGGTALVQGRGEHVVPLAHANVDWMVVVSPETDLEDKTARLYSELSQSDHTRGVLTHKLAGRIRGGGDAPAQFFFNAFEPYANQVFPDYAQIRDTFHNLGAMGILMSGAGPSMFALAPSREIGVAWQLMLEMQHGLRAYLVKRWDPPGQVRKSTNRAHISRDTAT